MRARTAIVSGGLALAVLGLLAAAPAGAQDAGCTQLGVLEGTAGPDLAEDHDLDADDEYDSVVHHCPETDSPRAFVRGSASLGPNDEESTDASVTRPAGRIDLSKVFTTETAWVFYHERGHNLGFEHTDGIMDYDKPDADPDVPLADETVTIAEHTEGLHYVDWSEEGSTDTLLFVIGEWRAENTDTDELLYAIDRWRNGTADDVYADDTLVETFNGTLPTYPDDTLERSVVSNGFYRNATTASGEPWR